MNRHLLEITLRRHLRRLPPLIIQYRTGLMIGVGTGAILIAALLRPDDKDTHQIFRQEGPVDFKNASILGNPGRALIQEEESNLSKTQRDVLLAQSQLKAEVEGLRLQVQQLKTPGGGALPNPLASAVPFGTAVTENGVGAAIQNSDAYGPLPAPSPSLLLIQSPPTAPGKEFTHTRISDQIRTHAAAPRSRSPETLGLSEMGSIQKEKKPGVSMLSFPVKSTGKAFLKKPGIILPSGSYVKAVLLTGIEAPEGKTYPVLMQLDFAYVIPNDKRLDLAGCFMIAKAQGDLSTERVQMQASKLSCVSRRGGMFEREVNGFVADNADNSFAVMGRVNSKQDRVAATAFLSSIVSGIGKAIQQAQTTQQTTPLGGSQSVVTGDQAKYIAAGGGSEAASMVTQWYLKQAQNLLPTINVGSGQEVWIIMQDQVDLPKDYFTQNTSGEISNASIFSHFTRLID